MYGSAWRTRYHIIKDLHHLCKSCIVHLDLRPTNIFLDDNPMPKVADFCLSRFLEENQYQAIASKQFGSMWPIESGIDSSSVVQKRVPAGGSEVYLRDAGKPSIHRYSSLATGYSGRSSGSNIKIQGRHARKNGIPALKIDPSAHTPMTATLVT